MIYKEPTKGFEAREKIKKGIDKASEAVKPTLGAVGMSAIIDMGGDYSPIESDDGITVLKNLNFKDRYEQIGLLMIRKAANRTNEEGGDGTSTTVVLTQALAKEAFKEIGHSHEKIAEVSTRLEQGLKKAISCLTEHSREVTEDDIERVATISSLDPEIGKIIADAYKQIGKDGIISVENSPTIGYSSEVVKGTRFNKGFISPYFINDQEKYHTVLENPFVLIVDRRIAANSQIQNVMEYVIKSGNPNILIIADSVEGEALASLALNHQRQICNVCCVTPPHALGLKKEWMKDIAILTGATVVSEEAGILLEHVDPGYLGIAEKVIVSKDTTTIVNGSGEKNKIDERVAMLKGLIENTSSEADKTVIRERLASLSGGIGVIRVGAITDTELRAKKYKIEDAVNATKAALEEGIVIGGGAVLAKIATSMDDIIFSRSLTAPLIQMAYNAGLESNEILNSVKDAQIDWGFNFKSGKMENLFETGVIDPVKVTRLALESAVSVVQSLARGETVIVEQEEKEDK